MSYVTYKRCVIHEYLFLFINNTFFYSHFMIYALESVYALSVDIEIGQIEWPKRPNDGNDD